MDVIRSIRAVPLAMNPGIEDPAPQDFLVCSEDSVGERWAALRRFAARFSFRDWPDFLVMVFRGDLSDTVAL